MKTYQLPPAQQAFVEGMRQPFAVCHLTGHSLETLAVSDGFLELFGYESRAQAHAFVSENMFKNVHPDDTTLFTCAIQRFGAGDERLDVVYRSHRVDGGGYRVLHLQGERVIVEDDVALAHVWFTYEGAEIDIGSPDERRRRARELREESLEVASRYDYLTGLPTMTSFFRRAEIVRKRALDRGTDLALLYLDLNGMKFFNHRYGFSEGDRLLRRFAQHVGAAFGIENCCHVSADRFAAVAEEDGLEERLHAMFGRWYEADPERHMPVCVGVYLNRQEAVPVGMAFDRAKIACDALRGTYVSSLNYYSPAMSIDFEKRRYILETFERALDRGWIQVYYQPILRPINNKVCHDEALARWIDPERGFLSPADFIGYLEDAGLIYRLDLYVVDRVLENMRTQREAGLNVVPHSVNLSRSDFDACDVVEEIRSRVDGAGIERAMICIEITESVIGSDFDFMKEQVERFQALGFPVWMDDFGSGYSSLDVLQSLNFDLLKFDMNFMRRLDESEDGKIILTELMRMATALGVDTVCEGVETAEQARFLQEIGCSKQQGFFYSRPTSFEDSMVWHVEHRDDGYERPEEADYYAAISGVNLFDVSVIAQDERHTLQNAFSTLPIAVIEVKGDVARFVRTNQAYRDILMRFFDIDIIARGSAFMPFDAPFMDNVIRACCEQDMRSFFDERMPDGSIVHSFARRIAQNPLSGEIAIAVAVLSVADPDEGISYVDIARALASDYYSMFVVDLETDSYIEYRSVRDGQDVAVESHGDGFFEVAERRRGRVFEKDREAFSAAFDKDKIVRALDERGVYKLTYRLLEGDRPVYVSMKVTYLQSTRTKIIVGISDVDAEMRQREHLRRLGEERAALGRVLALSDGYLALYTVDPDSGAFVEFVSSDDYPSLGTPDEGEGFFERFADRTRESLLEGEREAFAEGFGRERVLGAIGERGSFSMHYGIMLGGAPRRVVLRVASFVEGERSWLLASVRTWVERGDAQGQPASGVTVVSGQGHPRP